MPLICWVHIENYIVSDFSLVAYSFDRENSMQNKESELGYYSWHGTTFL